MQYQKPLLNLIKVPFAFDPLPTSVIYDFRFYDAMKLTVFWGVTPYNLVVSYQCIGGTD
jgi:hypothetical protein